MSMHAVRFGVAERVRRHQTSLERIGSAGGPENIIPNVSRSIVLSDQSIVNIGSIGGVIVA